MADNLSCIGQTHDFFVYNFNRFLHLVKTMVNPTIQRTTNLTQVPGETFNLMQARGDLTCLS